MIRWSYFPICLCQSEVWDDVHKRAVFFNYSIGIRRSHKTRKLYMRTRAQSPYQSEYAEAATVLPCLIQILQHYGVETIAALWKQTIQERTLWNNYASSNENIDNSVTLFSFNVAHMLLTREMVFLRKEINFWNFIHISSWIWEASCNHNMQITKILNSAYFIMLQLAKLEPSILGMNATSLLQPKVKKKHLNFSVTCIFSTTTDVITHHIKFINNRINKKTYYDNLNLWR